MSVPSPEPAQLLLYRFGAGSAFEAHLLRALERMEAGGALDAIVVTADRDSGEVSAVALGARSAADGGARGELIRRLAGTLGHGETIVALLVGHSWARALAEAVRRTRRPWSVH